MLAGLRTLWDQPVLRAATLLIMFVNTIGAGLDLIIIVILRHQSVPSGVIGLALGAGAAGGLAGAPLVTTLHRLRPGVLLLAVCLLDVMILALLAVPFGPWCGAGPPSDLIRSCRLLCQRGQPSAAGSSSAGKLW